MTVLADFRTLWRFPGFRRLLSVRLISQFSDGVFQVGLATYVVFSPEQQATAGDIAAAMAVLLLPYSLLGPFAGVMLDRWRRRQVLFYGNLLRALMAGVTGMLILSGVPDWLFYLSALCVTAVNRFILAGLSASLPRVVDPGRLVVANSLSPTAGTIAATVGGACAFGAQLLVQRLSGDGAGVAASTALEQGEDILVLAMAAVIYLLAGLAALRMSKDLLGPGLHKAPPSILAGVLSTAQGLVAGLRHLATHRIAAQALGAVALMRFCYGALLVTVLMLARYTWADSDAGGADPESEGPTTEEPKTAAPKTAAPETEGPEIGGFGPDVSGVESSPDGVALLGLAVAVSGAGFFIAAAVTPWAVARLGRLGWFAACAATAAVLVPTLGLSFEPLPVLAAAFVLGLVTQGGKIITDTVVQSAVDDDYRGRIFAVYDMLFNIAFVSAAGLAALMLPPDGRSPQLIFTVSVIYAAVAVALFRVHRRTEGPVSRET